MLGLRRRRKPAPTLVDDGTLTTVARAHDPVLGDAGAVTTLIEHGWSEGAAVWVRHRFALLGPATGQDVSTHGERGGGFGVVGGAGLEPLEAMLAEDGWAVHREDGQLVAAGSAPLTILRAAQMRALMTGLETRWPVRYLGWEAALPPRSEQAGELGAGGR